jgi:hypothetical protein
MIDSYVKAQKSSLGSAANQTHTILNIHFIYRQ